MNTPAAENGIPQFRPHMHKSLPPREIERRMKAAVQSASPKQVEAFDAALLVGCVDWYPYESKSDRSH